MLERSGESLFGPTWCELVLDSYATTAQDTGVGPLYVCVCACCEGSKRHRNSPQAGRCNPIVPELLRKTLGTPGGGR